MTPLMKLRLETAFCGSLRTLRFPLSAISHKACATELPRREQWVQRTYHRRTFRAVEIESRRGCISTPLRAATSHTGPWASVSRAWYPNCLTLVVNSITVRILHTSLFTF